jgi:hypothetical protein
MRKQWMLLLVIALMLAGCGGNTGGTTQQDKTYPTLTIQTQLTNPESKDDTYLVFLAPTGVKETEPGKATQSGFYGPFETDGEGKVTVDISFNWNLRAYLDQEGSEKNKLQVFITTKEDKYIRNPLNAETFVTFVENKDDETKDEYSHYSTVETLNVPFTDQYPEGVLSLTFPTATFVVKLAFPDGQEPKNSYEVSIVKPSATAPDGLGMYRIGRICRAFQYWDTPFFAEDNLKTWSGTIVVTHFDTNERIMYDGYPKQITFDENGRCEQGNIITVFINP